MHGSLEKSSKDSYRRVFAFYKEFMLLYFPQEMVFPASLENLTLFIAYCFQKKLASSTVLTYMSAISFLLQLGGYEDLTGHVIISKALRGYHKEKAAKDSRLPITPSIVKGSCQSLPKTCSSRFLQLMLHAMYLLAFHAFLRIEEISGLPPPNIFMVIVRALKFKCLNISIVQANIYLCCFFLVTTVIRQFVRFILYGLIYNLGERNLPKSSPFSPSWTMPPLQDHF